jgi:alginate O-acetyltransferase complex protein AlgI
MVFLTYEFVAFCLALYTFYYATPSVNIRKLYLIAAGYGFLFLYGGLTSVLVVSSVLTIAYAAGRVKGSIATIIGITACAGVLIFYKYTGFILHSVQFPIFPELSAKIDGLSKDLTPTVIPLGISFFTFEFIHYLVDVRRGRPPITNLIDFLCFGLFWPTMVAGPIKRYEQFIPALYQGLKQPSLDDLAQGLARIATGLAKKWAADNLTGWITYFEPQFSGSSVEMRWLFLAALAARILLDFSGYSDMAIGFARMFGIRVPENFNWPYLARSPAEFWRRWHISLSSWVRDYIYIPLGGNRRGPTRRVVNGLTAMALCGLWHGPSWNFAAWGVYHGVGLASGSLLANRLGRFRPNATPAGTVFARGAATALGALSWAATMLFVGIGWLLFFYPVGRATQMAAQLFSG